MKPSKTVSRGGKGGERKERVTEGVNLIEA
jgi:hypothetical protein